MFYGSEFIDRKTIIGTCLVLYRTTDGYVFVSVTPIFRQTVGKAVDTFGYH